ncbi:hypothetical protein COM47_07880 [Bacillus wiedmannii]|nr:hypothetical protein COM40_30150 [Bacillus wiedmannii]PGD86592.1 hypothetical protein COM47_07880 [Bacillus wiedmannii]PHA28199.1 hypothetical protein COE59_03635 [Bacillus wiedmannii]PHB08961.1 hypothetical protein COE84_25045 [Bacillus wiedmannii]
MFSYKEGIPSLYVFLSYLKFYREGFRDTFARNEKS